MKHNQRRQPGNKMWAATHRSDTGSKNLDQTKLKRAWNREITTAVPKVNKTGWLLDLKKKKKKRNETGAKHINRFRLSGLWAFFFVSASIWMYNFWARKWTFGRGDVCLWVASRQESTACQRCAGREVWTKACRGKKKTLAGMEEDLKARERWETHSSAWGEIMKNEEEENDRESRRGERDGGRIWRSSEGLGISSGQHRACGWEGSAERCGREISWAGWLAVKTPASDSPATHYPPPLCPAEEAERDAVKKGRTREKSSGVPG